jgi:S1-C subfamily serine protease
MVARQAATGFSGSGNLKAEALREADDYCTAQKKTLKVIASKEAQPPFILGNFPKAEVQFACLDPNDPELSRPRITDGPSQSPTPSSAVSIGTGFAIQNATTFVTAFHIVDGARTIDVTCAGGQQATAVVERIDPANDLALLKVSQATPAFLEIAAEHSVSIGQKVFTVGFPVPGLLGTEPKYSDGSVSSLSGPASAANLLQMTVPIQPGNSGGPLVDESGRVVAVVTSTAAVQGFLRRTGTLPQNINWAVRSEYLRPLLSGVSAQSVQWQSSPIERAQRSVCLVKATGT